MFSIAIRYWTQIIRALMICILVLLVVSSSAFAATCNWTGGAGDGLWASGANWDCAHQPTNADDVVIDATVTVGLAANTVINSLTLGNSSGTTSPVLNFTYDAITNGALSIDDGNLVVHPSASITHAVGTTVVVGTVFINVLSGDATIDGSINVDGKGYSSSVCVGAGIYIGSIGGGGGHGGTGGVGAYSPPNASSPSGGASYGSTLSPVTIGSRGGNGGNGGGAIKLLVAGTLTISGSIVANGNNSITDAGGGGSGGSVWINALTLLGSGSITANGGNGYNGQYNDGGGGGGGRIALYYTMDSSSIVVQTYGGTASDYAYGGGAGTVYRKASAATYGDLLIDNSAVSNSTFEDTKIGHTELDDQSYTFSTVTVKNYGFLDVTAATSISYTTLVWQQEGTIRDNGGIFALFSSGGDFVVPANTRFVANTLRTFSSVTVSGMMWHSANAITQVYTLGITTTGNFTINSGGIVSANGKGYSSSEGPGAGVDSPGDIGGGGGGGHGGTGGMSSNLLAGGAANDSTIYPITIGSGGGNSSAIYGGFGGGIIKLIVGGNLTVSGNINANGANGIGYSNNGGTGGGGGGSIWIDATNLFGNGSITAMGGNGGSSNSGHGGGGGGGRIALYYATDSSSVSLQAYGGTASGGSILTAYAGGAGTIYRKATSATYGDLLIDNNTSSNAEDTKIGHTEVSDQSYTFSTITIKRSGLLDITSSTAINYSTLVWQEEGAIRDNGGEFDLFSNGGDLVIPANTRFIVNTPRTFSSVTVSGVLTHSANTTAQVNVLNLTTSGDFTINASGSINVNGKGYKSSEGPGAGGDGNGGGGGGGYGGAGGSGNAGAGVAGVAYGTLSSPNLIGSGGGQYSTTLGGAGGGAVKLMVGGILTLNGGVSANGTNGSSSAYATGGGSGGSIWLSAPTLACSGTVYAIGGNGGAISNYGGGGGGGRILMSYASGSSCTTNVSGGLKGGATSTDGAAGTVYNLYGISGTITYGSLPLSGVTINAGAFGTQTTASGGTYAFHDVPDGTSYTVTPSMTGYSFSPTSATGTVSGITTQNFTATLNTYTLSGTITLDGESLSGVTVNGGALGNTVTDTSGNYAFGNIAHGTSYTITPSKTGYIITPTSSTGTITANTDLDFAASPNTYAIGGIVSAGGCPLAGVSINGGVLGFATTGADGAFAFANGLYGTSYTLTPAKSGYTFSPTSETLVLSGTINQNFTGALTTHTISGTITADGTPLSGVSINGGALGSTVTNTNGFFEFTNVSYGTSYTLIASKTNMTFIPTTLSGTVLSNVSASFIGNNEETQEEEPEEPAQPSTGVSGTLKSGDALIKDATITLYETDSATSSDSLITTLEPNYKTTTDLSGEYELTDVEPNTYRILAHKNGVIIASDVVTVVELQTATKDLETLPSALLSSPVYALWNGYLTMHNILEMRNKGDSTLEAEVALYAYDVNAGTFTKHETQQLRIPQGQQRDIYLNYVAGFAENTYGFVEITTNHNSFDGAINYYRGAQGDYQHFDYAFSLPFSNTITGQSYVLFNTKYETSNQPVDVYNWLSIVNPNDTAFKASVVYYANDSSLLKTTPIKILPKSRLDIDGGHNVLLQSDNVQNAFGLIEIVPQNSKLPYFAGLNRYSSNSSMAFGITATSGRGSEQYVAITNTTARLGILEIANTLNTNTNVTTKIYNSSGTKTSEQVYSMYQKQSFAISASDLLGASMSGTLVLSSDTPQAIIAQMISYQYTSDLLDLTSVEATSATESVGLNLYGSYNLYLNMYNWLRIFNTSSQRSTFTLSIGGVDQTLTLKPHARHDIAVHELGLPSDSYGPLTITPQTPSTISAQMLRVKDGEFIMVTPVR